MPGTAYCSAPDLGAANKVKILGMERRDHTKLVETDSVHHTADARVSDFYFNKIYQDLDIWYGWFRASRV